MAITPPSQAWEYKVTIQENFTRSRSIDKKKTPNQSHRDFKQAGAELGQAQLKLEVLDEVLAKA